MASLEASNLATIRAYVAALEAGAVGQALAKSVTPDAQQVELFRRLRLGFELLRDGGDFVELTWEVPVRLAIDLVRNAYPARRDFATRARGRAVPVPVVRRRVDSAAVAAPGGSAAAASLS
jgi:hypothetical protein